MYLAAVLLYLVALAAAAVRRSRQAKDGDEFLIARRSLPPGVLVFTLLSAWIGSGSLFAGAGLGYRTGFAALWQPAGAWVGIAAIYLVASRARSAAQYTVPDILELRYGAPARVLGTMTSVLACTTIAAYQFLGGGRLLHLVAGIDPVTGALVTAIVCIVCTASAGMRSIAYLDVGNGLMILVGFALAAVYLLGHAGGIAQAFGALRPEQATLFGSLSPPQALALFVPTAFLLLGDPSTYQKLFSARDERAARLGVMGWLGATICAETLIVAVGVLGSAVHPGLNADQSEAIVVRVALESLPAVLGMLLLAGAAAVIVSTANSFLLTPATNLVRDIYQRFVHPAVSDAQTLTYARVLVVALGGIAFVAGSVVPGSLATGLRFYTMYAAAITPALLAALLWPRVTRQAGLASITSGIAVTLAWEIVALGRGGYPLGLQTMFPALAVSTATLIGLTIASGDGHAVGSG